MILFNYLFIGHLIGDFLFQTNWMAMNKSKKWFPLLTHCVVYTLMIFSLAFFGGFTLPLSAIGLIFVSHVILDKRVFVEWWVRTIMGSSGDASNWLLVVVDQVFHILILAAVAHFWFS